MDIDYTTFAIPMIVAFCALIGVVIKHLPLFEKIPNKYIPGILPIIGLIANVIVCHSFSIETLVGGLASGLAAVGAHQLITRTFEKEPKA